VEEEKYFLALVRYIHRNPLRARVVKSVEELRTYPWTGHSVLMGTNKQEFQDVDTVLAYFGKRVGSARKELVAFMTSGEAKKEERFFKGGGLIRSIGGPENLKEHRNGTKWAYDERILGEGAFVESVLKNVATQSKYPALLKEQKGELFQKLLESLCEQYEIKPAELVGGSKRRKVSEVRS
jgi:REP-associated tyrosine transposase